MKPGNCQTQKQKKISLLIVPLLFIGLFLPTWIGAQSNQIDRIIITWVDESTFPQITMQVRVLDEDGVPLTGLSQSDFQLLENDVAMELQRGPTLEDDGPVWAHFVIDGGLRLSQAGRWPRIQESIEQFARRHMLPDDQVAVTAIEENRTAPLTQSFTRNVDDITAALDRYQPTCFRQECASAPLAPLQTILNDLDRVESDAPKFIIFFTGELERYDAQEVTRLADSAREMGISIYTVLVSGHGAIEQVERLARDSGGSSLTYQDVDSVNALYQVITGRLRPYYGITYRSTRSLAGTRQVQVAAVNGLAIGESSYTIDQVALPRVQIMQPAENSEDTPLSIESSPPNITLDKIVFTDNYPRGIQRAVLMMDGEIVDELTNPGMIEFPFPVKVIREKFENIDENMLLVKVDLVIEVTDELNLTARTDPHAVWVARPPPESPEVSGLVGSEPVESRQTPFGPEDSSNLFMAGSIIVLAAVMIFLVVTRDRGPVKAIRHTISKQIDRVTKRIVRQSTPRAYLIVLDGDANVGKSLELYGTTAVGRSKQDSELLFQQHDETSPISRRHCTIMDEEDHFQIRDEDSANGTYLNGVRLDSMVPRELQDGDEVELARVERGGVKLQFQAVLPVMDEYKYDDNQSFGPPRQTRAVRRPQQREDRF